MRAKKPIRLLPPELQNQIAAGEVVERPSSVVKELLENALDAGATRLRLEIRDGGQSGIQISDNGCGIPPEELELALTRHATSKLSSLEDLQQIDSFGFRGEALPSIASVSRFRISSATESGEGTVLEAEYGRILSTRQAALPKGTLIEITDLFSNVPARLKFLKQPATESRKCQDAFIRAALSNADVDFEFVNSGRPVFRFLAGQTLRQRLTTIWPEEILEKASDIHFTGEGLRIHGLTGDPSTAQGRADRILIYVNNRAIQDKMILSAIREAYRGRILGKEFPQAVLFIELPADEIDVNVHPAKTEIRFQDEGTVFRAVRRAIIGALDYKAQTERVPLGQLTPQASPQQHVSLPLAAPQTRPQSAPTTAREVPAHAYASETHAAKFSSARAAQELFKNNSDNAPSRPEPAVTPLTSDSFAYLGQFALTYLIIDRGDELHLIDQHAAHERVLYNAFRTQSSKGDRQPLLIPIDLSLHRSQVTLVQEIWQQLTDLGFSLELKNDQSVSIMAVPTLLSPARAKEFLNDVLMEKAKSMEDLWAVMSCRAAIKAGDALTPDEALSLIEAWSGLPDCDYCPHGRPVVVRWTTGELEKLFKRRP